MFWDVRFSIWGLGAKGLNPKLNKMRLDGSGFRVHPHPDAGLGDIEV